MNNVTPINVDGLPGLIGRAGQRLHAMREKADKAICLLDARMRTLTAEPEAAAVAAAGDSATVRFDRGADSVTVTVQCPVIPDPTGMLPTRVTGKATRYF